LRIQDKPNQQIAHSRYPMQLRLKKLHFASVRLSVGLCCLLLLLPMVPLRASLQVQRSVEQESEESREPTEEERPSEDAIDGRSFGRRPTELTVSRSLRTALLKLVASGPLSRAARQSHLDRTPCGELEFRNGVGGPLRC
jgi:hypothetical protein